MPWSAPSATCPRCPSPTRRDRSTCTGTRSGCSGSTADSGQATASPRSPAGPRGTTWRTQRYEALPQEAHHSFALPECAVRHATRHNPTQHSPRDAIRVRCITEVRHGSHRPLNGADLRTIAPTRMRCDHDPMTPGKIASQRLQRNMFAAGDRSVHACGSPKSHSKQTVPA